jgi:hypothetical protein
VRGLLGCRHPVPHGTEYLIVNPLLLACWVGVARALLLSPNGLASQVPSLTCAI